jgi:hypothetical protein
MKRVVVTIWWGLTSCCMVLAGAGGAGAVEYEPIVPRPIEPSEVIARREWLRWWIFDVTPRLNAQAVYDDNVNISSRTAQDDFIWVASPGITAVAGDSISRESPTFTLSYAPSFIVFTDHDEYDSIDHSANVTGIWPFSRLRLGFRQTFDQDTGGIVDVGSRAERRSFNTSLTSAYELSEKTSFEINARQGIQDYAEPLIGTTEWANDNWLNYLAGAKVVLGLGLTFGYADVERNPGQQYQRLLLRAVYNLTYKLDLTASVGGEFRQYKDGPDRFGAIFALGASYWPRDGTTISLNGHRDNRNSALLAGQNYISTGFGLSLRQRLLDRLFATLGATYEHAEYEPSIFGVAASRSEHYYLLRSSVDVAITNRWLAGLFYRHRENISNTSAFAFSNNQVGIQTSYEF